MNAAVLMFSACLAGADPMPVAPPPPAYPAPVVAYGGDNCGKATVCGDCDTGRKCCLFGKIKGKLFCCNKGNKCGNSCNVCGKSNECAPAQPVCEQPKVCCKVQAETTCDSCGKSKGCGKCCWTPGEFLHKCKAKLCGNKGNECGKGGECCGGVATAATPGACGSNMIPPPVQPAPPVAPARPPLKDMPRKLGSGYNPINRGDVSPVDPAIPTSSPKALELGPTPF